MALPLSPGRPALVCALMLCGCGLHPRPDTSSPAAPSADEIVITADQIAALSVTTAWDVIKRKVPELVYRENRSGEPTQVYRRGRSSLYLNEMPMLFVDGVRMTEFKALDEIPASQVQLIRVLSPLAGTTQYGTNAAGGVILVTTRNGS